MKKEVWGNATWYLFHTLAHKLKPEHEDEVKELYKQIVSICHNLPCPDCQEHAVQFLNKVNTSIVTSSKENLINFLWEFHNKVNIRAKTVYFNKDQMLELYSKANTQKIVMYYIQIMSQNLNNDKMMMLSLHRKLNNNAFKTYIMANHYKYNP
jgi:hypothetical protein